MFSELGLQIFIVTTEEGYEDILAGGYYPDCRSTDAMIDTIGTIISNYDSIKEDIKKRRGKVDNKLLAIHMLESAGDSLDDKAREKALKLYKDENFSLNGNGTINFELKVFETNSDKNVVINLANESVDFDEMEQGGFGDFKPVTWMLDRIEINNLEGEEKRILKVFNDNKDTVDRIPEFLSEKEIEYGDQLLVKKWRESLVKINSNGLYTLNNVPFKNWSHFVNNMSRLDDYPYYLFDGLIAIDYIKLNELSKTIK